MLLRRRGCWIRVGGGLVVVGVNMDVNSFGSFLLGMFCSCKLEVRRRVNEFITPGYLPHERISSHRCHIPPPPSLIHIQSSNPPGRILYLRALAPFFYPSSTKRTHYHRPSGNHLYPDPKPFPLSGTKENKRDIFRPVVYMSGWCNREKKKKKRETAALRLLPL